MPDYATALRHVFSDNHWELQCPRCQQFVRFELPEFTGQAPFPPHKRWHLSWVQDYAHRHLWLFDWARTMRLLIRAEWVLRRRLERYEPLCEFRETANYREMLDANGRDVFGPLLNT